MREKEVLQALDRVRPLYTNKRKRVLILTNLVLDIEVDRLINWDTIVNGGSNIEKAFRQVNYYVLPLSADYLCQNFSELFDNARKVSNEISNLKSKVFNQYLPYKDTVHDYELVEYRFSREKGKPKLCLINYDLDLKKVKIKLEQIFSKKVSTIKYYEHE